MSRPSTHQVQTVVSVLKQASEERFITILEFKESRTIDVTVGYFDDTGQQIDSKHFIIRGDAYDTLMSASPSFAPGKPANEYREVDLWYTIDNLTQDTP